MTQILTQFAQPSEISVNFEISSIPSICNLTGASRVKTVQNQVFYVAGPIPNKGKFVFAFPNFWEGKSAACRM